MRDHGFVRRLFSPILPARSGFVGWVLAMVCLVMSSTSLLAQTVTWDGGAGTGNWADGANWDTNVAPVAGDDLVFAGSTQLSTTNNIATVDISFNSITFAAAAGAFTLAGSRMTLAGNITDSSSNTQAINIPMILNVATCTITATSNITVGGVVSEAGGARALTKAGAGTLYLGTNNTYSGTTTVNAGTLQNAILNNTTYGTGGITLNGGTLLVDRIALANNITNSNASSVIIMENGWGSSISGTITNNALLSVQAWYTTQTFSGNISGAGGITLTQNAGGTLTLSGTNSYSGATTISSGTLKAGSTSAFGTNSAVTLANVATAILDIAGFNNSIGSLAGGGVTGGNVTLGTATLTLGGNGTSTSYDGVISGTGAVTKTGAGTQTLTRANTYAGVTTVSAGILQIGNGGTTGSLSISSTITVTSPGVLAFNRTNTVTGGSDFKSGIGGTGAVTQAGSGTLIFSGANTYAGATTVSAGTLQIGNGGTTGSLSTSSTITNNATLVFNRTDTVTGGTDFKSGIGGTGAVTQAGSGTLIFSGTNTYTGATTISAGILQIGNAGATGSLSASSAITNNATLTFNRTDAIAGGTNFSNTISGTGAVIQAGTGTVTFSGAASYTGTTTINAGILVLSQVTSFASSTTTVNSPGILELTSTTGTVDNWRINTVLAGAGTINKTGSGWIQTFTNAHTFSGTFNIQVGTFGTSYTTSNWTGMTADFNISAGALLDARAQAITVGSLNGAGSVGTTYGFWLSTVNVGAGNKSGTFSGVINGNNTSGNDNPANPNAYVMSLTKTGSGTQILSGANIYTGTTTISAGTLQIGNGSTTGALSSSSAIVNNATLTFNRTDTMTGGTDLNNVISGTGAVTQAGSGTVIFAGTQTYTGTTTISAGTLRIGNGGTTGSLSTSSTITNNATLTFNRTDTVTGGTDFKSGIGGTGAVTQAGSGTLILTGACTYTGATTISAGTLQIGNAGTTGSLSTSSTITNNATLRFNRTDTVTQGTDFKNVIGGTGAVTQAGSGILLLNGANTFTGTATVSAGTIKCQGTAFSTTPRTWSIASGAVLNLDGNTSAAFGTTTINGAGTLRLTGGGLSNGTNTGYNITLSMGSGGLIDVQSGASIYNGGWQFITWTANLASLNVDGSLDLADGLDVYADALTGSGTVGKSQAPNSPILRVGVNNGSGVFSGVISNAAGTLAVIKSGSGTQTLSGVNTYTGTTTITAGVLSVGTIGNGGVSGNMGAATNAAANLVFNGGTLQYTGSTASTDRNFTLTAATTGTFDITTNTLTVSGASTATTGALTKIGSGTLLLSGTNSYTGATTISGGTLKMTATSYATPSFSIATGTVLEFNLSSNANYGTTTFSGAGTLRKSGSAAISWQTAAATFQLSSGALIDVVAGTFTGGSYANEVWTSNLSDLTVASGATFASDEANTMVNAINGAGTITSGYPGAGYVKFTYGVDNGSGTFSGVMADEQAAGNFTKAGTGTQTLTGTNTYTGATTISAGTLQIGNAGTTGSLSTSSTITNNATLIFNRTNTVTGGTDFKSGIGGTGAVTQAGSGTLILTGACTYTGATTISAGTLQIGNGGTTGLLSTSSAIVNNATLMFNRTNTATQGTDFINVISGSGAVIQMGAGGTLVLNGANTYTGTTSVQNGTLSINTILDVSGGASAVGAPTSAANGTIALGSTTTTGTLVYTGTAQNTNRVMNLAGTTGGGIIDQSGTGLLKFTSAFTATGVGAKTLTLQGSTAGTGEISAAMVNGSGTTALTKTGTGVWTLSGTNTYTGATTVSAGTLLVTGSTHASSAVAVNGTGTLGGTGTVNGTITMAAGGTIAPGLSGVNIGTLLVKTTTMHASSIYSVDLSGASSADLLSAAGQTVTCAGTLTVANNAGAALGNAYTIISAGTVSGTFSGLANNAVFAQGGRLYRMTYTSTTVTLTDVAPVVSSRGTMDANGNGKLDRIRLTFDQNLNDDVSGLTVTVAGYTVTGFSTGTANDAVLDVLITELGSADTGAIPLVRITANTSLKDAAATTLVQVEGAGTAATDTAKPVLLSALYVDGGTNGVSGGDGDTLVLTFSENVTSASMVVGDLTLPVSGDTLSTSTIANKSSATPTITVALVGTPLLSPGNTYASGTLGAGKPSGIYLSTATNLRDQAIVPNTGLVGASAADAVDIGASPSSSISIEWNDTNNTVNKIWTLGTAALSTSYESSTYTVKNIGYSTVALATTSSNSTSATTTWTVQPAVGANQFTMKADASTPLDTVYELTLSTSAITLAPFVRSGTTQDFKLQLSTPTTSATAATQAITVTITASQY